jgi:hypothetical protein
MSPLRGRPGRGLLDQGAGNGDALLLAAGQLRRQLPQPVAEAGIRERLRRPGPALGTWMCGGVGAASTFSCALRPLV